MLSWAKYTIAACGIACACKSTYAENGRYILWGAGNDSCATFVQERAQGSARFQTEINWIAGSVSRGNGEWHAMMTRKGIETDILKGSDSVTLEAWLVKYCNEHPLSHLGSAALALEKTLYDRLNPSLDRTDR
jgi:hypothetical protein